MDNPTIRSRLKHGWNAFMGRDPTPSYYIGSGSSYKPDRRPSWRGNDVSIIEAVNNRIAVDAASIDIEHVKLDKDGRFSEVYDSTLNKCLNLEANIDQSGRAFIQDCVASMIDEGVVAIVPITTNDDPTLDKAFQIETMRTGRIVEWYPNHVRVDVYNELTGMRKEITLPKSMVAIAENPFYSVMNAPNSTARRLVRKLNILDVIDEQSGSGKLDLIVQLPYTIKSEARRQQAEERKKAVEDQLSNSKYGIAYIDAAEHITQLNRSVDNNLLKQIEYLTSMLYSQLNITQEILNGTADEKTMSNYYYRTIEPIIGAITDAMIRTFLTSTARSQGQSILYFRDPFKLVPVSEIAEIADKFTRNEIATSNEMRQAIGWKPSSDPNADVLRNKNLSEAKENKDDSAKDKEIQNLKEEIQNGQ